MNRYVANGDALNKTLSGDAPAGTITQVAGLAGIIPTGGKNGDTVAVQIRGLVAVEKAAATTFSAGAVVEYDEGDGLAVAAAGGDFQIGIAAYAAGNGPTEVYVLLNAQDNDTVA